MSVLSKISESPFRNIGSRRRDNYKCRLCRSAEDSLSVASSVCEAAANLVSNIPTTSGSSSPLSKTLNNVFEKLEALEYFLISV